MKVTRRTETTETLRAQGPTSENVACIRPRSNAVREDASLVEYRGIFTTGC